MSAMPIQSRPLDAGSHDAGDGGLGQGPRRTTLNLSAASHGHASTHFGGTLPSGVRVPNADGKQHHVWVWGMLPEALAALAPPPIEQVRPILAAAAVVAAQPEKAPLLASDLSDRGSMPGVLHVWPALAQTIRGGSVKSMTAGYRHVVITTSTFLLS